MQDAFASFLLCEWKLKPWRNLPIEVLMWAILNKSWRQHHTRHWLYGHLPPITETIKVRRTRHAGHYWRSRDELISDVLLWTPTYGRAKAGRPARTYIQQLCEDTGCSSEDLAEAMNDREKWRERIRDIRASGTTWWWWYIYSPAIGTMVRVFTSGPRDSTESQFESYQTLSIIRYGSWVKGSNPENGVAPLPTPRCCSCWKESLWNAFDYGHQLFFYTCIIEVYVVKFSYLPNFRRYFIEACSFSVVISFNSTLSSSPVNCPCLMSTWPSIIF